MNQLYFGMTVNERLCQNQRDIKENSFVKNARKIFLSSFKVFMTLLVMTIIISSIFLVFQLNSILFDTTTVASSQPVKMTVQSGDTLWTIAQKNTPEGMHFADYMKKIKKANNLNSWNIVPGQLIVLP
jgi:nucleoid-associated protein YgaU